MMVLGRTSVHRRKSSSDSSNPAFSEPLRALELAFREADQRKSEGYRRGLLPGGPTLVEHGPIRILISAAPSIDSVSRYAQHLKSYNVRHVVRVCEPTYPASRLRGADLHVHDWAFSDGDAPPQSVVDQWLALLDDVFNLSAHAGDANGASSLPESMAPKETVAVHCMAGLGRAPVLVAIALVELGMDPFEAVGWIRALRRGAINSRQMAFLENYKRRPVPAPVKQRKARSNTIGSFLAGIKASRALRPKSPLSHRNSPVSVTSSR